MKLRALALSTLMVMSVLAVGVSLGPGVVAAANNAGNLSVDSPDDIDGSQGVEVQSSTPITVSVDVSAEGNSATFAFTDDFSYQSGNYGIGDHTGTAVTSYTVQDGGAKDQDGAADGTVTVEVYAKSGTGSFPEDDLNLGVSEGTSITDSPEATLEPAVHLDNTAPSVDTVETMDNNRDGNVDRLRVWFDENIEDAKSSLSASDYTLSAGTVESVHTGSWENDSVVYFEVSGLTGTSVTPDLISDASPVEFQDEAGNILTLADGNTIGTTEDNALPTISTVNIYDTDDDAKVDKVDLVFSETIDTDDSSAPVASDFGTITLPDGSTADLSGASFTDPDGTTDTVTITGITGQSTKNTDTGSTGVSDFTDNDWNDAAGNPLIYMLNAETVGDNAAPVITSASTSDSSGNGDVDTVMVTMSESVDDTASNYVPNDHFTLSEGTVDSVGTGYMGDDESIFLQVSGITGTGATPTITQDGAGGTPIVDPAGNSFTGTASVTATDGARPQATTPTLDTTPITGSETGDGNEVTVTVSFTEDMTQNTGDVTVTPDVDGDLTTTPQVENERWSDAQTYKVDLQFTDDDETVTGVTLEVDGANDLAGNPMSAVSTTYDVNTANFYAGGTGTESDPYEIANWEHLNNTRQNLGANFTLVADLNKSTTGYDSVANASANGGAGFAPIGNYSTPFTGTFDGNGYTIANLTIDRPAEDYVGLFGNANADSVLTNVTLEDVDVTGSSIVGGLVGYSPGSIENATASGPVNGTANFVGGLVGYTNGTVKTSNATGTVSGGSYVGGLVGYNSVGTVNTSYATGEVSGNSNVGGLVGYNGGSGSSTVKSSYATGKVSATDFVGGLVGVNNGTVKTSYATGKVSGSSNTGVGGLIGASDTAARVSDSYWDTQTTERSYSSLGRGLTTAEMTGTGADSNLDGFDFTNTWDTNSGSDPASGFLVEYPTLTNNTQDPAPSGSLYADGDGTEGNEYEIANWYHLNNTRQNLGANFTLVADLNKSTTGYDSVASPTANAEKGFAPIGHSSTPFTGTFDGNGYTIADLTINRSSEDDVGLFGATGSSAEIANANLEAGNITGGYRVAVLVGLNKGNVSGSFAAGTVTGTGDVGGLIGKNIGGAVNNSSASVVVTGDGHGVGGLAGYNDDGGAVSDSYATGNVTSTSEAVGGLIGANGGQVTDSYATGTVDGPLYVGGLLGTNAPTGTVVESNATGAVTGHVVVGGLVGVQAGTIQASDASGPVTGNESVGGLVGGNGIESRGVPGGTIEASNASGQVTLLNSVSTGDKMGGLVGQNFEGTVTTSNATGDVQAGNSTSVGGLVGYMSGTNAVLKRSVAVGNVTGSSNVGGLVGANGNASDFQPGGTIETATASGTVTLAGDSTDPENLGGLVGQSFQGTVTQSNATGDVNGGDATNVGGLVGYNDATEPSTIRETYATGAVDGGQNIGGLVGKNVNDLVTDSYAIGSVNGSVSVGGLVGINTGSIAKVNNSYAAGSVTGDSAGGLVGTIENGAAVETAYWDVNTTGQDTSAGGTGLTTSQLKANTSLTGFDFDNTWAVKTGGEVSYPHLLNNPQSPAPGLETIDDSPPSISTFSVSNPSGQDVQVSFDADEQLSTIEVSITGAESTTLTTSDFDETDNGDGSYTYKVTYAGSSDGTYTATLETATDSAGNDGASDQSDSVDIDTSDTTGPSISRFAITNPSGQDLRVTLDVDKQLSTIEVTITRTESATLRTPDFTETANDDGTYTYVATYAASSDGDYTAWLQTAADADGNDGSYSQSAAVTVDTTPPTADAGSNQTVKVGTPFTLNASASTDDVGIASYEWDFGDNTTATGLTATHTYDDPGTYTVTLTVTDTSGNTDTDTLAIDVTDTTPLTADAGSNKSVILGETVNFDGTNSTGEGAIVSYNWTFGDGTTATGPTPTHTYDDPGNYTVALTVTDENGNTGTDSLRVQVAGPRVVDERPARNIDDDMALEDVNGDGRFSVSDVQALFANRNSDPVTNYPWLFDFNDDGRLTISDVQAIWAQQL